MLMNVADVFCAGPWSCSSGCGNMLTRNAFPRLGPPFSWGLIPGGGHAIPDSFLLFSLQGRHVKTGQLAAIKVMDVTEVRGGDTLHLLAFGGEF